MAAPTITPYAGQVPVRTQDQSTFSQNTADMLEYIQTYVPENNTLGAWMNTTATQVENDATTVVTYANSASSAANYAGEWSTLSGAQNIPLSVSHNGVVWLLKANTADITLIEPSYSSSEWLPVSTFLKSTGFTVTVGASGDFTDLQSAIDYVSNFIPVANSTPVRAEISLLSGFVMAEQIIIDGLNLGWVDITGVDATTTITRSSITAVTREYAATSAKAVFTGRNGAIMPKIKQQFGFDSSGSSVGVCGLLLENSQAAIDNGGFSGEAEDNLYVLNSRVLLFNTVDLSGALSSGIESYNSTVIGSNLVDCSGCARGLYAVSSSINIDNLNATSSGSYAVVLYFCNSRLFDLNGNNSSLGALISGGFANIESSTFNSCTSTDSSDAVILIEDAARVAAKLTSITGSLCGYSVRISDSSSADFETLSSTNTVYYGLFCNDGSTCSIRDASVSGNLGDVICLDGSTINAHGATASFNIAINTLTADGIIFQ